jgi:DNA-binding MarR family transcriptional regulator
LNSNYLADRAGSRTRMTGGELPDVLQFMQVLWAVVHGLEKTSKRMAADIGVTGPQRLVLRAVGLFPGASAGDLAALLHLHPSTLTGVLQRLTDRGLLARVPHPLDRRRAVLRLTRRGHRVNATSRGTVEAALAATLRAVSPPARRTTQRVLEALARELGGRQPEVEPAVRVGRRRVPAMRPRPGSSAG